MKQFLFILILVTFLPNQALATDLIDADSDGLNDDDEINTYHTDPKNFDTDGDGFADGQEIKDGYSPTTKNRALRQVDSDNDGAWDDWEIALGTDISNVDSDGDGFNDGHEIKNGYDPASPERNRLEKSIKIDLKSQTLQYFFGAKKLDEFKISGGLKYTPTPTGKFKVIKKRPIVWYKGPGYSYPNTKWNLMFKQGKGLNYYVHGAYWHNDFGKPKSHGCVNVPHKYEFMGRLYDWAEVGTPITIQ